MKVAIAGAGAVGRSIARELVDNHDVTLLERNPEHIDVDAIPAAHWRLGDACELSLLESVKLEEFDVVIAATGDDKANVVVSLLAAALSVSGAIFLIIEMYSPYAGLIQISPAPLRSALAHLGQ